MVETNPLALVAPAAVQKWSFIDKTVWKRFILLQY